MKSKIFIDVDHDNQPIIRIEHYHSDDVRDKLVAKFLETFAHASVYCRISHQETNMEQVTVHGLYPAKIVNVRPVTPKELAALSVEAKEMHGHYEQCAQQVPKS